MPPKKKMKNVTVQQTLTNIFSKKSDTIDESSELPSPVSETKVKAAVAAVVKGTTVTSVSLSVSADA